MRVREVESSIDITPLPVSLKALSLTSALHSLNRIRDAFQLHTSSLCSVAESVEEVYWNEEEEEEEEEVRSEVVFIEH